MNIKANFLLTLSEQGFRLDIIGSGVEDEVNIKFNREKTYIYIKKRRRSRGFFLKSDLLVLPSINKKEMFEKFKLKLQEVAPVISSKIENSGQLCSIKKHIFSQTQMCE